MEDLSELDRTEISSHLSKLPNAHLLVVGDAILDAYHHGKIERISPEAPIPIFASTHDTTALGGAANVVNNLNRLDVPTHFISVVGDDPEGETLTQIFDTLAHADATLLKEKSRPTSFKTRYMVNHQHVLRVDREVIRTIEPKTEETLLKKVQSHIGECTAVILSDYGKGTLTPHVTQGIIRLAHAHNKPIIVDPKGTQYEKYRGATILTPNLKELIEVAGYALPTETDMITEAQSLIKTFDFKAIALTRGKDGITLIRRIQRADTYEIEHHPTRAREVFEVSGAGDTVIATLSALFSTGATYSQAIICANTAAGIVVGKVGTSTTTREELSRKIDATHAKKMKTKIQTSTEMQEHVLAWRRQGLKVGFTNGCFDLLHPGHLHVLNASRATCDRLIVGLNSDASIKRLKGPERPIQSQDARALVLASLECVDAVVLFEADTPRRLIELFSPDVLAKGGDYTLDQIVGANHVRSYGGKVEIISLIEGQSTTRTIERMSS